MTELALTPSQTTGRTDDRPPRRPDLQQPRPRVRSRARSASRACSSTAPADPVPDGLIEIWQANAAGRYAHPADDREEVALESGFTGFGRSGTEDGGRFESSP